MHYKINNDALEVILEASRNVYPNEFIGLLGGNKTTITEIILLPASVYGNGFSSFSPFMAPLSLNHMGTVHSHPSGFSPSRQDLTVFSKQGKVHIIAKPPYESINDLRAFDSNGKQVEISVK
ncbi:MAG: Mov34/MPN/PAD-1 family protein [Candidatus Diapherotrites archaeon]|nr:Mov34/MPN/PAD-1 family protein [Candidatus Diapherotrites archaeon]